MQHNRRLFLLLAICLTVLSLSQLAAQDESPTITPFFTETSTPTLAPTDMPTDVPTDVPTETPLPTLTPTPLPSPSETPTDAPTSTATETATETPTAEISESPTATATAEASESSEPSPTLTLAASPSETSVGSPSPTATASITPTATATASSDWKVLFTDNFDTGELMLWKLGQGWGLVPSESGQALQAQNTDAPLTFLYNTLGDASVQMRVLLTAGAVRLSTRQSDAGAYSLLLDVNGQVSLLHGSNVIGSAVIAPAQSGAWRTIGLSVLGNNLSVTIDGIQVITAQDAAPLPQGTFSVAGINAGTLLLDDVSVSTPNNLVTTSKQRPQPSPTTSPTFPGPSPTPNKSGLLSAQLITCPVAQGTVLGTDYAIVAGGTLPTDPGDVCGLKKAIDIANSNTSVPVNIFLGIGTYALDVTQSMGGSIRIFGRGVDQSIITQINNTGMISGIMTINNTASVELHNITLKNGLATNTAAGAVRGGAILMYNGTLKVFDSKFETNVANTQGGALNLQSGAITIVRSIFLTNSTQSDKGGAIYIGTSASLSVNITCSRFQTNTANTFGGAIYSENGQGVILSPNNAFIGNTASSETQIANGPTQLNATGNWFAVPPVVPNDIDGTVTITGSPGQDPTSGFVVNPVNYYGTNDIPAQGQFPCQMNKPEQALRDEINTYNTNPINPNSGTGLSIYYPGALGSSAHISTSPRTGTIRNWTFDEMVQVLIGVQNTAASLGRVKSYPDAGTTPAAKQLLGTIMGSLDILRVENGFAITNGDGCNGSNTVACTSNTSHFIAFYGNVSVDQQTMVHELGHRFNGRTIVTGTYPQGQLLYYVSLTQSTSCWTRDQNGVKQDSHICILDNTGLDGGVMVPLSRGWNRGARGWGSGPGNAITEFQKHPPEAFPNEQNLPNSLSIQFDETTADMFLNWIYRERLNEDQGFKNISWLQNDPYFPDQNCYLPAGCVDDRNPGQARFDWMNVRMPLIFSSKGW